MKAQSCAPRGTERGKSPTVRTSARTEWGISPLLPSASTGTRHINSCGTTGYGRITDLA